MTENHDTPQPPEDWKGDVASSLLFNVASKIVAAAERDEDRIRKECKDVVERLSVGGESVNRGAALILKELGVPAGFAADVVAVSCQRTIMRHSGHATPTVIDRIADDYESRAVDLIVEARLKAAAKTKPATEKGPAK